MSEFKSFFKTVGGNEGGKCHYPTRLDLYGCGCAHDCAYCYAKSLLDFRGLWKPGDPAVADIEKVRKKIRSLEPGSVVRLGGMTDCFQPAERRNRVTYEAIKALNGRGVHYLIVTKSSLVAGPEYMEIMDRRLAHIQVSVTSTNDALGFRYEKADPESYRIMAVRRLQDEGFDVCLRLSPFIPGMVDLHQLGNYGIRKILVEFLRVNTWVRKWMDLDFSEYTVKQGGYLHLPLSKKIELVRMIKGFDEITICEDEDEAFAYWRDHFNPNKDDCCNLRMEG